MDKSVQEQVDKSSTLLKQLKDAIPEIESQQDANNWTEAFKAARVLSDAAAKANAEDHQRKAEQLLEEAQKAAHDGKHQEAGDIVASIKGEVPQALKGKDDFDAAEGFTDVHGRVKTRTLYQVRQSEGGQKVAKDMRFKALGEGTSGAGGYLVPPQFMQNLFAETRRQGNALRRLGLMAEHPVESNLIYIPQGSGAASVGVVAEGDTKPSADQAYTQIAVNIFTWAGISKISKQLAMDSSPTVADLVPRELGSLLGNLEEQKILNGSGTGEPTGILGTSGVNAVTATNTNGYDLIGYIIDGIVAIQTTYFGTPNAIAMAPRRWGFLAKAKDTNNNFLFNNPGVFRAPADYPEAVTSYDGGNASMTALPSVLGLPLVTTANMPLTLSTNRDAIIVGDFKEAHWFQRQDVTFDMSDVAGTAFETNQIWTRVEERAGFTAARYPKAFAVLTGAALASTNI